MKLMIFRRSLLSRIFVPRLIDLRFSVRIFPYGPYFDGHNADGLMGLLSELWMGLLWIPCPGPEVFCLNCLHFRRCNASNQILFLREMSQNSNPCRTPLSAPNHLRDVFYRMGMPEGPSVPTHNRSHTHWSDQGSFPLARMREEV